MPRQRSVNKEQIGAYVDKGLKVRLQRLATQQGITMTDLITNMLTKAVKEDTVHYGKKK